jgi:phenylacetate-coenzyme A ligase PaaK-like adenylate-forming protein
MAGAVATYVYLGLFWTIVALFFLLIGVVPFGMIGAAINSDWIVIGFLAGGLVLTYGARAIGARVAAIADRDQQQVQSLINRLRRSTGQR